MTTVQFSTFPEAADFAKRMRDLHRLTVTISRYGGGFLVEGAWPELWPPLAQTEVAGRSTPTTARAAPVAAEPTLSGAAAPPSSGICIGCGVKIPNARLLASPSTLRCVSCQGRFEQSHDTGRRADEGISGSREANRSLRGQDLSDMRKRARNR